MYDRYTIYSSAAQIREQLVAEVPEGYKANYNASSSQLLPIIMSEGKRGVSFFHWGLMTKWSHNKSISAKSINRTAEEAFVKKAYRRQLETHRCIIPMNGFYAWKKVSKKQKVPYYFHSAEVPLLGACGMWEEFEDIDGSQSHSFILLTVPSSGALLSFETQMPAILTPNDCIKWLDNSVEENEALIREIPQNHPALSSHPVNPAISSTANNYPELINAVPPTDQHGNYTLFT